MIICKELIGCNVCIALFLFYYEVKRKNGTKQKEKRQLHGKVVVFGKGKSGALCTKGVFHLKIYQSVVYLCKFLYPSFAYFISKNKITFPKANRNQGEALYIIRILLRYIINTKCCISLSRKKCTSGDDIRLTAMIYTTAS